MLHLEVLMDTAFWQLVTRYFAQADPSLSKNAHAENLVVQFLAEWVKTARDQGQGRDRLPRTRTG